MDELFIYRVLLSFIIAGGWIAISTFIAERHGSKIGGLVGNLPSNILVSLIFITIVNDVNYLTVLIPGIPIGLIADIFFLLTFIIFLRFNLAIAICISLLVWFLAALCLAGFGFSNFSFNVFLFLIVTIIAVILIEYVIGIPSKITNRKKQSLKQMTYRAAFGGFIVAAIVVISKFCNPYYTGIFSAFPAVLLSALIILTINQGRDFAMAAGKVFILSLSNIMIYVMAVYYTYPIMGIVFGTLVSYLTSAVWILLLHPIVRKMS